MSEPLFIYAKDGVIRCLTMQQSIDMRPLIEPHWKHTATIDPVMWIEALSNKGIAQEAIEILKGGPQ